MARRKRCKRRGHTHHTRYALCWSKWKGLFVCRCRNHPLGVVTDADADGKDSGRNK